MHRYLPVGAMAGLPDKLIACAASPAGVSLPVTGCIILSQPRIWIQK